LSRAGFCLNGRLLVIPAGMTSSVLSRAC